MVAGEIRIDPRRRPAALADEGAYFDQRSKGELRAAHPSWLQDAE